MNLYKIERTDDVDYDQYDADIVAADDESDARKLSVVGHYPDITVTLIGVASDDVESGIVLASFNAG